MTLCSRPCCFQLTSLSWSCSIPYVDWAVFGRYSMALFPLTTCLQWILGFAFTASSNGLSEPPYRDCISHTRAHTHHTPAHTWYSCTHTYTHTHTAFPWCLLGTEREDWPLYLHICYNSKARTTQLCIMFKHSPTLMYCICKCFFFAISFQ